MFQYNVQLLWEMDDFEEEKIIGVFDLKNKIAYLLKLKNHPL